MRTSLSTSSYAEVLKEAVCINVKDAEVSGIRNDGDSPSLCIRRVSSGGPRVSGSDGLACRLSFRSCPSWGTYKGGQTFDDLCIKGLVALVSKKDVVSLPGDE